MVSLFLQTEFSLYSSSKPSLGHKEFSTSLCDNHTPFNHKSSKQDKIYNIQGAIHILRLKHHYTTNHVELIYHSSYTTTSYVKYVFAFNRFNCRWYKWIIGKFISTIWCIHKIWKTNVIAFSWWRHQMETFSALLAICAGNSPVTGEFPPQKPVTRSLYIFFDLLLNKRLS